MLLHTAPLRFGGSPVYHADRAGVHSGEAAMQVSNNVPRAASRSMLGVAGSCTSAPSAAPGRCQCAGPYADTMSRPCVSVVMNTIGGGEPMRIG